MGLWPLLGEGAPKHLGQGTRVVPGEPGTDWLCPGWLRGVGGGKGRENMSTEGSSPFLWLEIVLPVLSRASWWLCSTVSSMGR